MLGTLRGRMAMLAALAAGLGAGAGSVQPVLTLQANAPRRATKGLFGGSYSHNPMTYGGKGAGITMAQQKRASRKAKNVKRHRRAGRG